MNLITEMRLFIKNFILFTTALITITLFVQSKSSSYTVESLPHETSDILLNSDSIFNDLLIQSGLSEIAFEIANEHFYSLKVKTEVGNDSILTVIDFSKPSGEERLFILDMKNKRIIKKTLVAHGKNTGLIHAEHFSNIKNSLQSSLGLYFTGQTYYGKHGYSLRLDGVEPGLNTNARQRAIVVHGANYVSKSFIRKNGHLGRSFGCPALPVDENEQIINLIKNKSCLFIYHPSYSSKLLAYN